jgi:hypothetical protein
VHNLSFIKTVNHSSTAMFNVHNKALATLALIVCTGAGGCGHLPSKTVHRPSGQGYGTISVTQPSIDEVAGHVELCYWDVNGNRTLIWPTLNQLVPLGKDAALSQGYLINGPSDIHAGRRGPVRLFGVRETGPVVDITDDVHLLWLKPSGTNFSEALGAAGIGDVKKDGPNVSIRVYQRAEEGRTLRFAEDEILDMIRAATQKGKELKDPGLGTPYLKRDREAEAGEQAKNSGAKQ